MQEPPIARYWGRKSTELVKPLIRESDIIVDPFGGSGSIVLSALRLGKKGVYLDLNPYAWLVAHVSIAGANPAEFRKAALTVLEMSSCLTRTASSANLRDDHLRYRSTGKAFLKQRNFDRISEFFTENARKKLRAILMAIDIVEAGVREKLALYLAFCNALYLSSLMRRCGAGSWGVPSYWAPAKSCPEDPFHAFSKSVERLHRYFIREPSYSIGYDVRSVDVHDSVLLIGNAVKFGEYRSEWTLITDPPHVDEIQYMELSFFYWAWLKESEFPNLIERVLGKRPRYYFSKELVVNRNRGQTVERYMNMLTEFMHRTSRLRKKVLIYHEENEVILNKVIELAQQIWGTVKVEQVELSGQRCVGPRGSRIYTVITSM